MATKRRPKLSAIYLIAILGIPVASLIMLAALSALERQSSAQIDIHKHYKLSAIVPGELPVEHLVMG